MELLQEQDMLFFMLILGGVFAALSFFFKIFSLNGKEFSMGAKMGILTPLLALVLYLFSGSLIFMAPQLFEEVKSFFTKKEFRLFLLLSTQLVGALLLLALSFVLESGKKNRVWGESSFSKIAKGVLYGIMIFPFATLASYFTHHIIDYFTSVPPSDQVAIALLKEFYKDKVLLFFFFFSLITIIPLAEELLFRGFFQNTLVDIIGGYTAVGVASIIFAFFHYAPSQGMANYELLVGLFFASMFIGIVYQKESSLLTSIASHATFNAVSFFCVLHQLV